MKAWEKAELKELSINETEQNIFGNSYDGGYIGDGHIGILEWDKPGKPGKPNNGGCGGNNNDNVVNVLS